MPPDGMRDLSKTAFDIAFRAAGKASVKTGVPALIGMPPISYFRAWFQAS